MKIMFTGGGSAGHVTPNLPLMQMLQSNGVSVFYCGSSKGIERSLIQSLNIPYYSITTGKLRRYWSFKNFLTPFQLICGIFESFLLCRRLKPAIIFSKGGFVALPVVIGAWLNRIPVMIHESDITPGLANRLSFPFAQFICVTFPETAHYFKNRLLSRWRPRLEILTTGMPIREFLYHGSRNQGLTFCRFSEAKPVLLIMAGGLGSVVINDAIRRLLKPLTEKFQIIHLCGRNKCDLDLDGLSSYRQFEYLQAELADMLACADLVISRAGATSIYELLALGKPHILLPLSRQSSRGDQIENADYFYKRGFSTVLYAEALSDEKLLATILDSYGRLEKTKNKLKLVQQIDSTRLIVEKLLSFDKHSV